jgi:hypothetical protein
MICDICSKGDCNLRKLSQNIVIYGMVVENICTTCHTKIYRSIFNIPPFTKPILQYEQSTNVFNVIDYIPTLVHSFNTVHCEARKGNAVDVQCDKCCGIQHPYLTYIIHNDGNVYDNQSLVIAVKEGNAVHSTKCNRIACNTTQKSFACQALLNKLRTRLATIETSIKNGTIINRHIQKNDPPSLLKLIIQQFRKERNKNEKRVNELESIIQNMTNKDMNDSEFNFVNQILVAMKSERWDMNSVATNHIITFCRNMSTKTKNGHRYSQEFYRYVYYFKYMTNKKGIQLQSLNFGWPSNISIRSLNVDWFYGVTPRTELEDLITACSRKVGGNGPIYFGLSWDETDPRDGLEILSKGSSLMVVGMEDVITLSEFSNMNEEEIIKRIGTKIFQVYFKLFDGSVVYPMAFWTRSDASSLADFAFSRLCSIVDAIQQWSRFKFIWTSSDCDFGNAVLIEKLKQKYNSLHIYDPDHLCKLFRNPIIDKIIGIGNLNIRNTDFISAIQELGDELNLPLTSINVKNVLRWKPCENLIQSNYEILLRHSSLKYKACGQYISMISDFYKATHDNSLNWHSRYELLINSLTIVQKINGISSETKKCAKITVDSIIQLQEQYPGIEFHYSSMGTLDCELCFSIIRHKTVTPSVADYCQTLTKAHTIMRIRCAGNNRGFDIPKTRIGKAYNDLDVILEPPILTHRKGITKNSYNNQVSDSICLKLKKYKPANSFITVASTHKFRVPRMLACFMDDCQYCKIYSRAGDLANHLIVHHHMPNDVARDMSQHLQKILETHPTKLIAGPGDINCSQQQNSIQFTCSSNLTQQYQGSSGTSNLNDVSQENSIVTQDSNNSVVQESTQAHILKKCLHCKNRKCPKNCNLCADCCRKSNKNCNIPSHRKRTLSSIELPARVRIFLMDYETPSFDVKNGFCDVAVVNVEDNSWLSFSNFVKPRNGFPNGSVVINNSVTYSPQNVVNGIDEKSAFQKIVDFTKSQDLTIIYAHNSSFESNMTVSCYRHWISEMGSLSGWSNQKLMFVDTRSIFEENSKNFSSYTLQNLYRNTINPNYEQKHHAKRDVEDLLQLLNRFEITGNQSLFSFLLNFAKTLRPGRNSYFKFGSTGDIEPFFTFTFTKEEICSMNVENLKAKLQLLNIPIGKCLKSEMQNLLLSHMGKSAATKRSYSGEPSDKDTKKSKNNE